MATRRSTFGAFPKCGSLAWGLLKEVDGLIKGFLGELCCFGFSGFGFRV